MVFALVSAYTAPALMTVCLLTDYWIYGNQTKLSPNPIFKPGDAQVVNYTFHRIGLWRECGRESTDSPYLCEIVKYSKTEAKSVKGFKAVACKFRLCRLCLKYDVLLTRSISAQHGVFHRGVWPSHCCYFLVYARTLQTTSKSGVFHLRTFVLYLRYVSPSYSRKTLAFDR